MAIRFLTDEQLLPDLDQISVDDTHAAQQAAARVGALLPAPPRHPGLIPAAPDSP